MIPVDVIGEVSKMVFQSNRPLPPKYAKKTAWENLVKAFKDYSKFDPDTDYVLYHLENEGTMGGSQISSNLSDFVSDDEILSSAIEHYGEPAQVLKCIEESVELALALSCTIVADNQYFKESMVRLTTVLNDAMYISKYEVPSTTSEIKMYTVNSESVKAIVSELADVSITTSQMIKLFTTPEEFEKAKQAKLSRLADMISGKYNPGGDCGSIGDDETFEDIHGPVDDKPVQQKAHELMEGGHIGDDSQ